MQQSIFKGKVREESHSVCGQLVHSSDWLMGGGCNRVVSQGLTLSILNQ